MKQMIRPVAVTAALVLGSLLVVPVQAAPAPGPGGPQDVFRYPSRGAVVDHLPRGHRVFHYKGLPYHFYDGIWYRPVGSRFMVVLPPVGLLVPALPAGAVVVTLDGVTYFRHSSVYYVQDSDGYRVVQNPEAAPAADTVADELFVYPKEGQSAEQQANDRFECHEWAGNQTGYDPTRDGGGVSAQAREQKRSDYLRAMTACLEARGYSVR